MTAAAAAETGGDALVLVDHPLPGCARVTLNRPRARNALSRKLRQELAAAFAALAADAGTRVMILTGAGSAFSAGLDLKELGTASDADRLTLLSGGDIDPVAALGAFPGPVIGAINGPAVTGGFELALACDVLIASEAASFADTHAHVGVLPGWGLSQRLGRAIGIYRARELSLTGAVLPAARAADWGLVSRVVPAGKLMDAALEIAGDMLAAKPAVLAAYKRVINDGYAQTLHEGLRLEKEASTKQHAAVRSVDTLGIGHG
jgi:enoyl-CoA hydratase